MVRYEMCIRDRDTAPAQGLFLYKVNYSEEEAGNTQAAQEITAKQE